MCAFEMADQTKPEPMRATAGLMLKNALTAKDSNERDALAQKWLGMEPDARNVIKKFTMETLRSPISLVRGTAAQVMSYIGCIELPYNAWPELIPSLMESSNSTDDNLKQSTLDTLGYLCEEIEDPKVLSAQSNQILTAVCQGIKSPKTELTLSACKAMLNALEFVKSNFEKEVERTYIMQVLCDVCTHNDVKVRTIAMECLAKVGALYYDKLPQYMQKLFAITLEIINRDQDPVALQAIEFWTTICEEERDIMYENEEDFDGDQRKSEHFIRGALPYLIPVLTNCLTKQEDEPDDADEWNICTAAATCIDWVTQTVGDEVVAPTIPFIEQNINNSNWKLKEAAITAFGSIMDGPKDKLKNLIVQALPLLLKHMSDPSPYVRQTTVWCIGRICQHHPSIVVTGLQDVFVVLVQGLSGEPKMAAYSAWAIQHLADHFSSSVNKAATNPLSPFFPGLVQKLTEATQRRDADENELRVAAYEAITALFGAAAVDSLPVALTSLPGFTSLFEDTINNKANYTVEKRTKYQGLLSGVFTAYIRRVNHEIDDTVADKIMELLLRVPSSFETFGTAHADALLCIGVLAGATEARFEKYLPHVQQFLLAGLRNVDDHEVCNVSVGLVGDICRAVGPKIAPYCDQIVNALLSDLQNGQLHRDVKPAILSCFGDLALAINGEFVKYTAHAMNVLQQASHTKVDSQDVDLVDYLNSLRDGIFEAYTGIILGLKESHADPLLQFVPGILDFVNFVWQDPTKSDSVVKGVIGVLADVISAFGNKVKTQYQQPFVRNIINDCCKNDDDDIKQIASLARELSNKAIRE